MQPIPEDAPLRRAPEPPLGRTLMVQFSRLLLGLLAIGLVRGCMYAARRNFAPDSLFWAAIAFTAVLFVAAYFVEKPAARAKVLRAFDSLDGPHRLFVTSATAWALVGPFLVTEPRALRDLLYDVFGVRSFSTSADVLAFVFMAATPPLVAYLLVFYVTPPITRWIAAGYKRPQ